MFKGEKNYNLTFDRHEIDKLKKNGFEINYLHKFPLIKNNIYNGDYVIDRRIEKPNIIIIFTEGFSARTSSIYNEKFDKLTPNLEDFSKNKSSMLIDNYYSHTAATYRGLHGQLCSIYPTYGGVDGWHDNLKNLGLAQLRRLDK